VKVLPDTPIWSAAFRKGGDASGAVRIELERLTRHGAIELIGPIRQEILSGIREQSKFEAVRDHLRSFQDLKLETSDYETAATYYDSCRSKGIQGSFTDFLICSVSVRYELSIFTPDKDFIGYAKVLPIRLYEPGRVPKVGG
jgi:predicted nucleic acid-binding protein